VSDSRLLGSDGPIAAAAGSVPSGLEIVESKLWSPRSRPGAVVRTTLLDRLAVAGAPVVTVVAPAGYGKTTLLGQWVERHAGRASTWISLDHHDNDPGVLLRYLVEALERVDAADPKWRRTVLAQAGVDISSSVHLLASWIASMRTPFLLVLDHLEAIQSPLSGDLIAAVALNLPDGSQLALASRTAPPVPIARLRTEGLVEEIGLSDLAMDDHEALQLFASTGTELSAAEVTDLVVHTEGWPAGLYLAGLVIAVQGSRTAPLTPPSGNDRAVSDYLRAEIISSLAPSTVNMLVRTSILDRLSGPLCDAVTATTGSQELLESLELSNMLVLPLDRERRWYRCHHLLGEMLRAELDRTEPEMLSCLHGRASMWFEADGQFVPALDHAQLAGDGDRAAALFCRIASAVHGSGRADTVLRWLRWFEERGEVGQQRPVAALGAILESLAGDRTYSQLLADVARAGDQQSLMLDGSTLAGWIAAAEACLCRRGVDRMRDDAGLARTHLGALSPLRGPAMALEGVAALMQGDLDAADTILEAAAELCSRSGNSPGHAASLAERAVIALDRGDTAGAHALSEHALQVVATAHVEAYTQATVVYAVAARTAMLAGELHAARSHVSSSARLRPRCTAAIPWSAQFLVQLAHAYLALGDTVGAREVLRQVRDIMLVAQDLGTLAEQSAELSRVLDSTTTRSIGASSLTVAELRLLPFLATHLSYEEIGHRLYISRNTVKSEAMSMYRKLGASSRSEAIETAQQIGLLGR
jgi:LuxR family transcriptional regulator, maltose regulon positive regulatory protein